MRAYCLILMAASFWWCFFASESTDPLAVYLRIRAGAVFVNLTPRYLVIGAGALLIAALVWQLAGVDFAFVLGGEVMAYLEIAIAVLFAAARTRIWRSR